MRIQSVKVVACGVAALLAGCAGGSGGGGQLDVGTAGRAEKLELLLDDRGNLAEVEYHLMPEAVPEAVRAAMRNLHPGARVFGAEREALKGVTYWELAREANLEREVSAIQTDVTRSRAAVERGSQGLASWTCR